MEDLAKEMKHTLQKLLVQCLQESKGELANYNIEKYPSQLLCLAEGINFTSKLEKGVTEGGLDSLLKQLKGGLEKYTSVDYSKSGDSHLIELKYKALIMDVIHYIEVVELLINENCRLVFRILHF